jgi:hypothetical protein
MGARGPGMPCAVLLVLAGTRGASLAPEQGWELGYGHTKWDNDKMGWREMHRVVGAHMNVHSGTGLNMAEKIKLAGGAAKEVAAIERTAKISGSLVETASREEFYHRLDNGQVFVRNGTLYRSPAVDLCANLSALSDGELDVYALECGIPPIFFLQKLPRFLQTMAKDNREGAGAVA